MAKGKGQPQSKDHPQLRRIIGMDLHPDIFSTCHLSGTTPQNAQVHKREQDLHVTVLEKWAKKQLRQNDLVVIESSANSFEIVRQLEALGHCAVILESAQVGKVADNYFDNDLVAAERIGRCFLTGLSKIVWVADEVTVERRQLLHAYQSATRAETRAVNELRGLLTQYQVRPGRQNLRSEKTRLWIEAQRDWSENQRRLLDHYFEKLAFAVQQSEALYTEICREVLSDTLMSGCLRLLGVGPINAFCAVATVGDVNRFTTPEKLVNYLALHPGSKQSGNGKEKKKGVGRRGRKEMRTLLIQAAQTLMRQKPGANALRDWGWKLFARKGNRNVAVVGVARRMAIQLWHLLQGNCTTHNDQKKSLTTKLTKLFRRVGREGRITLGFPEKASDAASAFLQQIDQPLTQTL